MASQVKFVPPAIRRIRRLKPTNVSVYMSIAHGDVTKLTASPTKPKARFSFKRTASSEPFDIGFTSADVFSHSKLDGDVFPDFHKLLLLHQQAYEWLRQDEGNPVRGKERKAVNTAAHIFNAYHLVYNDFSRDANKLYAALFDTSRPTHRELNDRFNDEISLLHSRILDLVKAIDQLHNRFQHEKRDLKKLMGNTESESFITKHMDVFTV